MVQEEQNTLEEDQQIAFTFELSLDQNQEQTQLVSEPVVHNLEDAKDIEVNDIKTLWFIRIIIWMARFILDKKKALNSKV